MRMLHDAWRLGHRVVASKLAELYSEGRLVKQHLELAAAWLAQDDHESDASRIASRQGVVQHATFGQKAPISLSCVISLVQIHEAPVKETIKARLQQGSRRWCLRDVLRVLVDRACLPYALASDMVTTIAAQCFRGSADLDKLLEVDALNAIFPFMADTREQKDSFHGQRQLKQLYGDCFLTRRLRKISTSLFTELARNYSAFEHAFMRFARPENRCHVLVSLSLKGLSPRQCDEQWQHCFSRFLECKVEVGLVKYESRRLDVASLNQELRLFRQGKPHALFLFDDNDFDKKRRFGVPRMRSVLKGPGRLKTKPTWFGWHGKTLEAVKDPETLVTTYHDLSHPLSISAAAGGPAMSNQVRVGESDLHEMWTGRVGEGSQELYDKSVARGVVTEFTSETPGTPLMSMEEYASRVRDDLEWARAHLRYGGTVVIPAPDGDPAEQGAAAAAHTQQTVRHNMGRLLPQTHKATLQRELDELMVKACADAVCNRDRRGWLPKGSPFCARVDEGDTQVCTVDIVSQHAEYVDSAPTMVLKLQMVTKNPLDAQTVSRRVDSLIATGILTDCLRMYCLPKTFAGSEHSGVTESCAVNLHGKVNVMHPVLESNMQQPFVDQPIKLNLLSLPNFMKLLSSMQVQGVCNEGCKERHFGKMCNACGQEYSEHNGHVCPDGGQGFFEVDRLPELIDAKRILYALAGRGLAVSGSELVEVRSQDAPERVDARESHSGVASDGTDPAAGESAASVSSGQLPEDGAAAARPASPNAPASATSIAGGTEDESGGPVDTGADAPLPLAGQSSNSSAIPERPSEDIPAPPESVDEPTDPQSAVSSESVQPPESAPKGTSPAATTSGLDASQTAAGSADVPKTAASSTPSQDSGRVEERSTSPQGAPTQMSASPMPSKTLATTASGIKWKKVGSGRPRAGSEIKNEELAVLLKTKLVLSKEECEKLNLTKLPQDCYIKVDGVYVRPVTEDGMDEEARETDAEAAAHAAKLSAKRRRFVLAQALQHKVQELNKENTYRPTGDIHGVDCRQFSRFFEALTDIPLLYRTLPLIQVKHQLAVAAGNLFPDQEIQWPIDYGNSDLQPRLINTLLIPFNQYAEVPPSLKTCTLTYWEGKQHHCKFDLAQCLRVLMPHKYTSLSNVRRALMGDQQNKAIPELDESQYPTLQYAVQEFSDDEGNKMVNASTHCPMMSAEDVLSFMKSDFAARGTQGQSFFEGKGCGLHERCFGHAQRTTGCWYADARGWVD
eukprot:Tamp_00400.p1 GENE.Tamp_00400~~Tamp_00400.p1  ORF type:complete len:1243 (+),score=155.60 Tamp_00400:3814-7542(+)